MYRIVTKEPGKKAEAKKVEALELKDMQELVGGYIQMVWIDSLKCILWCDEEHKLKGDTVGNIALADDKGNVFDIVGGKVFFAGEDGEGENASLTIKQEEELLKILNGVSGLKVITHHEGKAYSCPVLKIA